MSWSSASTWSSVSGNVCPIRRFSSEYTTLPVSVQIFTRTIGSIRARLRTIVSNSLIAAGSPDMTFSFSAGFSTPSPTTSVSVRASRIAWSVAVRRSMYVPTVPITISSRTTENAHW